MHPNEKLFKSLAADYADKKGEELLRELDETAEGFDEQLLNGKMQTALVREKTRESRGITRRAAARGLMVASLLLAVYVASSFLNFSEFAEFANEETSVAPQIAMEEALETTETRAGMGAGMGAPPLNDSVATESEFLAPNDSVAAEFIFLRQLPVGWSIIFTDYDGDLTIFHLESGAGNSVVVIAGEPIYDYSGGEFRKVFINEHPAFMRVENSHSILFFDMDGFQFVLSTSGEPDELFALAENWL
jgi:hypothetical protein